MYTFRNIPISSIDTNEFYSYPQKVPFTHLEWLEFVHQLKGAKPIVLSVQDNNGQDVGHFIGCTCRFLGIKVLGSPFWGWIGQHMGFDLKVEVDIPQLIDDLIDFSISELKVGYIQLTDFKIDYPDIVDCKHKLIDGERYLTCYVDLYKSKEELFKNLKSGYRTCIRKFEKDGGIIEEDYTDEFIEEHHRQLEHVFTRAGHKTPNYRQKMRLMFHSDKFSKGADEKLGVYSIKALLPVGPNGEMKSVASSYYIHNGYMAMFASNASYSEYLKSCPNQALSWHAMMTFKEAGLHYLDMGGSGSYKLNFTGGDWEPRPTIIYSKNKLNYTLILGLKRRYGKVSSALGHSRNWIKEHILRMSGFGQKVKTKEPEPKQDNKS